MAEEPDSLDTGALETRACERSSGQDPLVGETLSHYRILDRIGEGGMGVVYKAEDTRLARPVAVKLIPSARTHHAAVKERFLQEARTASALDHRNICTIHAIEEAEDGRLFIVMAFYEGETLDRKLRRAGPLPEAEALQIARQAAEGLASAHDRGIVHRDIKPANLMITSQNEVKVLDFGLAKLAGEMGITEPGSVLGTLSYMSPEQVCGLAVDHRTDVWALGVVLYEMLAGRRPFEGPNAAAVLYSIVHDDPRPLAAERRDLQATTCHIVERCLARHSTARFPSIRELLAELQRLTGVPEAGLTTAAYTALELRQDRSVLVLPLANLGGGDDYFSDGLTDEIITDLSRIDGLRVISRTAAARLKGTVESPRKLAQEMRVEYVLEGSVRRQGDDLRITAKLVDARTEFLLWAEKYAGRVEDVFTIQETISRKIVEALKVQLSASENRSLAQKPFSDFGTYDGFLKARYEFLRYSAEGLERAQKAVESQLASTGENPLLLSALGQIHWQYLNAGISSDPAHLAKARDCAETVLSLEPDSPHGLRLLGMIRMHEGDAQEGARLLKRALAGDPGDTDALAILASCYGFVGKPYAGVPLAARLVEIDPLTPMYQCIPGVLAMMAGAFGRALDPLRRSHDMDPGNPAVALTYGQALALAGRKEEACAILEALERDAPGSFFARLGLLYRAALLARPEDAHAAVTPDTEAIAASDLYYSWSLAQSYALTGATDQALAWLERAVGRGFINYPLLARLDPFLEPVRSNERFAVLMAEVRRRWEAFEV